MQITDTQGNPSEHLNRHAEAQIMQYRNLYCDEIRRPAGIEPERTGSQYHYKAMASAREWLRQHQGEDHK